MSLPTLQLVFNPKLLFHSKNHNYPQIIATPKIQNTQQKNLSAFKTHNFSFHKIKLFERVEWIMDSWNHIFADFIKKRLSFVLIWGAWDTFWGWFDSRSISAQLLTTLVLDNGSHSRTKGFMKFWKWPISLKSSWIFYISALSNA